VFARWGNDIDLKGVKIAPEHFLGDYPQHQRARTARYA